MTAKNPLHWPMVILLMLPATTIGTPVVIEAIPGQADLGTVEIHGVSAGPFDPAMWRSGSLNLVPDIRHPLLAPCQGGGFRNIYAPSPVEVPSGWRLFYGAWDGVHTGNDRIYSRFTADFIDFGERRIEIEHGTFIHVCNVNAVRLPDGSFRVACTAYPDVNGRNKPAIFTSPDGIAWNGKPAPYPATASDVIRIEGYPNYDAADINGMNGLRHENGKYRLYFGDFKARLRVHRASSDDGRHFKYDGVGLDAAMMVNDVRDFIVDNQPVYLMALHANTSRLWYALSGDGMRFEPQRQMAVSRGDADRYIVAVGWVTSGDRLLGFVYGAGAVPSLDRNRLFARWLQKELIFTDREGRTLPVTGALGPDRQIISLPARGETEGRLEVLSEDGKTRLGEPLDVKLTSGRVYRLIGGAAR
ncbi:MAG: hypothetical protein ACUVXJ_18835 [Phycisphaerae bacterium]